jgi:two-component system sensor histidine kinase DesK
MVTVAVALTTPVLAVLGTQETGPAPHPAAVGLLGAALVVLQLRHSLAASRGVRPRAALFTLLALAAVVYAPIPWIKWNWLATQALLIASCLMILRGRIAIATATTLLLATLTAVGLVLAPVEPPYAVVLALAYWTFGIGANAAVVYGAAWLVRAAEQLQSTRAELAELSLGRERLRLSRDLHDLLGHSLSAVSLKGDLALRLIDDDPGAAHAEIQELTTLARDTLHQLRSVTHGTHAISLRAELDSAAWVLAAAGVEADVDGTAFELPPAVDEVLAWAVREAVTNVLRHSDASHCRLSIARNDGTTVLTVSNDGARTNTTTGTGLTGLAERASSLAGSLATDRTSGGHFRLLLQIPGAPR